MANINHIETMKMEERLTLAEQARHVQLLRFAEYDAVTPVPYNRKRTIRFENALYYAVADNDLSEVVQLLHNKADPNAAVGADGLPALHHSIIEDNEQIVRLLLHHGADINSTDSDRWTPLHTAAAYGYVDMTQLLIEKGANLLALNDDGKMPYETCDDEPTLAVIESAMAARGINQRVIDGERTKPEQKMLADMKLLHEQGHPLNVKQPDGCTYLHVAAANGYSEVVAFLLKVGVMPVDRDSNCWTPLQVAVHWDQHDIVDMLGNCGADVIDMFGNK